MLDWKIVETPQNKGGEEIQVERERATVEEEVTNERIEELKEKLIVERREKERLVELVGQKREEKKIKESTVEEEEKGVKQVKFKQMIAGGAIVAVAGTLYYLWKN